MNLKDKTCCFSGHRNLGKYDYNYVYQRTKDIITLLAENGIVYFGTGGAIGFDTIGRKSGACCSRDISANKTYTRAALRRPGKVLESRKC